MRVDAQSWRGKDYFSANAAGYATFRPVYPQSLYDTLLDIVPARGLALDCGTGNGQAAAKLAQSFTTVHATDISDAQLALAPALPNLVLHSLSGHEAPPAVADATLDLITAAQAAHWFEPQAFVAMALKKLKPRGIIAVWGYGFIQPGEPELARAIMEFGFGAKALGPYWDPEVAMINEAYKNYPWPFEELPPPDMELRVTWTLPQLMGYFGSWSAAQKFKAKNGAAALDHLARDMIDLWGAPDTPRDLFAKIPLRLGRRP